MSPYITTERTREIQRLITWVCGTLDAPRPYIDVPPDTDRDEEQEA